ncbi:MAG: head maturation protease, ClpP-related [Microbacteriaceae bacterium]
MNRDRARIGNLLGQQQRPWWRISNATGETAELWIYDEISLWGVTADAFAADLRSITASNVTLRLNSPGGDVFDGIAIYNSIRSHPARFTAKVDSLAASIASVILQAADHRVMVSHSQAMIHDAVGAFIGNAEEMVDFAALLEKQSDLIAEIYAERAGGGVRRKNKFRDLMRAETWLSDAEAVDLGLADEIERPTVQNTADLNLTSTSDTVANTCTSSEWRLLLAAAESRSSLELLP